MLKIEELLTKFENSLGTIETDEQLNSVRQEYLGKSGHVTDAMKQIKDVPNDQKKAYGEAVNKIKVKIEEGLQGLKQKIQAKALEKKLKNTPKVDLTIPYTKQVGSLHPITIAEKIPT